MADIFVNPWPGSELSESVPVTATANGSFVFNLQMVGSSATSESSATASNFFGMRATAKTYSPDPLWLKTIVPQLIPAAIFEGYPRFVELLEQFCDTIEKRYDADNNESPGAYYPIKYFDQLVDLDETREDMLEWFKRTFAVTIPQFTSADTRFLIKHAIRFYVSRGTKDSIKFLLNTFFGDATADVYEPKTNLLRASDATWYQPYILALCDFSAPSVPVNTTVLGTLFDQELKNLTTGANCYVGTTQTFIRGTPVITIIDKFGSFLSGDILTSSDGRQWIIHTLGLRKLSGRWLTTDSFLPYNYVQDNRYWQDFSYEISSNRRLNEIAEVIAANTHPAGLLNFVKTSITDYGDWSESLESFVTFVINYELVDTDAPSLESSVRLDYEIEVHVQAFTDWSEFLYDIQTSGNVSHAATMDNMDVYTSSYLDLKSSNSHILFNWGQRLAIPYLQSGQDYVSPYINEASGNSVRINLEDFPMEEFDDVPMFRLETAQIASMSSFSGFDTFVVAPADSDEKVFTMDGTAVRADRNNLSHIAGVVTNPEHQTVSSSLDTGLTIPEYFGSQIKSYNSAIFPDSKPVTVLNTGETTYYVGEAFNAVVYDDTGKVFISGFDYHLTDGYIIFSQDLIDNYLRFYVLLTGQNQVAFRNQQTCFETWYHTVKPLEETWLDFSKVTLEILP